MNRGILYVALASFIFGCNPSINKYIIMGGMNEAGVVFWGQLFLAFGAVAAVLYTRRSLKVSFKQFVMLMLVGGLGMGCTSLFINIAFGHISVGLTIMLHFMYPTLVTAAMCLFFKERFTKLKLAAIVCSVVGMFFLANPGGDMALLGILLALCSSVTYAFYIIANDKSCIADLPQVVKLVYGGFASAAVNAVVVIAGGASFALPGDPVRLGLLIAGGLSCLAAHYLITTGILLVGAAKASFLNMLEPITNIVVSTLIYHDPMTAMMAAGCVLVIFSVFLVAKSDAAAQTA